MAGRSVYRLTSADFGPAVRYLERARALGAISSSEGYGQWSLAKTTPERLQAWCDDYLPEHIWGRLRNAVRQARKRSRDYKRRPRHSIDLSHPAWVALTRVAGEMGGVTLSEAVMRLEIGYDLARDAGLLEKQKCR